MAIDIEETLHVKAPPDLTWDYLLKAENVVKALPGAKLLEIEDERHFVGQMKVRVGTVSVTYKGDIEITEIDEENRFVKVEGKWKEKSGAGSAKMAIEGRVKPHGEGGSEITFNGSADVVGRIVQFGRGMIKGVSEELFKQFAAKVKRELEERAAAPAPAEEPLSPDETPTLEGPPRETLPAAPAEPEEDDEEISALPLLFKVLWRRVKDFFGRLFGGSG